MVHISCSEQAIWTSDGNKPLRKTGPSYDIKKDIKEGSSDSVKDVKVKCLAFVRGILGFTVQMSIQRSAILHKVWFILDKNKWYLTCKGAWVMWRFRGQAVLGVSEGGRGVVLDRHSASILGWGRLRSYRHPGNSSTIIRTWNAKALYFWYCFPINLYWYKPLPQQSRTDWQPFQCLIFQPNTRDPFITSRKKSQRHKTIFVLSAALVLMLTLILSSFLYSVQHWF
jgi:hypothetical protein